MSTNHHATVIALTLLLTAGCGGDDGSTEPPPTSTGRIQVTLVLSGTDLDADGCQFTVDAGAPRTLFAGENTTFTDLLPGNHSIQITGVASNCSVQGEAIRSVSVTASQTTAETFAVSCASTLGAIEVTTVTAGNDIDPDGYTVSLDGVVSESIDADGSLTLGGLSAAPHSVELRGLAPNCQVSGDNPRVVSVTAQQTAHTAFQVECLRRLHDRIVFSSDRTGQFELFVVDPDGSNLEQITSLGVSALFPSVAPDGHRIAFTAFLNGNYEIATVNSNGGGFTNLTQSASAETSPDWSPDGARIAFSSDRSGPSAVWVMNADGSAQVNVSGAQGSEPSWSPDGTRIAFLTTRDSNSEIYAMNADGSAQVNITNNSASELSPAWSPDGLWIAFTSDRAGADDIFIMAAGGGGAANVTESPGATDELARWSPDGTHLVFYSNLHDTGQFVWDVYTVETNGTNRLRLTSGPSHDLGADWGPQP